MSHANTIQIFHVNTFFFFFWCILFYQEWLVGQHPHAVNRMEYHILDMLNNHEKSLYLDHGAINLLFITFPLRIRNFVLPAYQLQGCNCWKSPGLSKDIWLLASFSRGKGLLMAFQLVPWTYLGIKTLSLGFKNGFYERKGHIWRKM